MTIETPQGNDKQQDRELAYAILRLALGVNLFGHAFVRILGGVGAFVSWLAEHMSGTALPAWLVRPFGYFLTAEECVVGALLVVGLWTRPALLLGSLVMVALTWGAVLKQDWPVAGLQLTYSIAFFLLLFFREYNRFSLDAFRNKR
jgi:thiosulfate dehydrogenase [quinone] large subunit